LRFRLRPVVGSRVEADDTGTKMPRVRTEVSVDVTVEVLTEVVVSVALVLFPDRYPMPRLATTRMATIAARPSFLIAPREIEAGAAFEASA